MRESFVTSNVVKAFLRRHGRTPGLARAGDLVAAGSFEVLIDGNNEGLGDGEGLGAGLADISSRLLNQLSTGAEYVPDRHTAEPQVAQRDNRGNRVPLDPSPLVTWKRVFAVSSDGDMLGFTSVPAQTGMP